MPTQDDFPKSVVLYFPPSVYQKFGAAEMIPNLLEILHVEDLRCVYIYIYIYISVCSLLNVSTM